MHISLDGFVAGPNGELNWIKMDQEMMDFVATMTSNSDTALYGRVTYQLMESYWPMAGQQENASKFTIDHAKWYKNVSKIVLSTSLSDKDLVNTSVFGDNITDRINKVKEQEGKNILIFGSPAASLSLLNLGLIDEFYFFVNPIIKSEGMQFYKNIKENVLLELIDSKTFPCGVIALHYKTKRD